MGVVHDLTAPFSARQRDLIGKLDFIVNVASRCSVDESIRDPADFVAGNVLSTLTVLELARRQWTHEGHDVRLAAHRLVHLSTDEVHGPAPSAVSDAFHVVSAHQPSSPYAASKAAQEDLVHAWGRTYGIPTAIFVSANMFGERQSQLAFIPRVIAAATAGRKIQIHTWHGGVGRRRYTYVRNTAQAITDYLTKAVVGPQQIRQALSGQAEVDNLTLALTVAELVGQPLKYELVDGVTLRPGYDNAYGALGGDQAWAKIEFERGLERTVKWYVDHPEWLK